MRYSEYGFIIMTEEEEKKLARLEKRLVANVDFDDQALQVLGFHTDIYYMLGHLGWVQFSNGVLANTHKELSLEFFLTMAPSLMKECQVSLSIWKELSKWFPMSISGNYLIFKREPRNKWMCMEAHWMVFGV
jgi:hypothetical protein